MSLLQGWYHLQPGSLRLSVWVGQPPGFGFWSPFRACGKPRPSVSSSVRLAGPLARANRLPCLRGGDSSNRADCESTRQEGPPRPEGEDEDAGARRLAAARRRLPPRLHHHPEEAE